MKLKRKCARTVILLAAVSVVFILLGTVLRNAALIILGTILLISSVIYRVLNLRCPNCGKYCAPARWNYSIKTYHCPGCGNALIYDDE